MKAAYYDRLGPASEVLVVGDVATPHPGPGEVRVRVAVSGLNPTDIKARTGYRGAMAYPRIIPHQDGAGVIDAVGTGVAPTRVGERVWIFEAQAGRAFGTAAQFVVVPEENVVTLAPDISFETGASLGIAALTAHQCLFADGDLEGKRVLVHGGAGVVGEAAILLAKWGGAWTAATVRSAADAETARALGADLVINMRAEDTAAAVMAATGGAGVDRIVEVDLIANLDIDLGCLARGGAISTYAVSEPTQAAVIPVLKAMGQCAVLRFVLIYNVPMDVKRRAVYDVTACLAAGAYRPTIGLVVPLEDIAAAHEALDARKIKGKILVSVASWSS